MYETKGKNKLEKGAVGWGVCNFVFANFNNFAIFCHFFRVAVAFEGVLLDLTANFGDEEQFCSQRGTSPTRQQKLDDGIPRVRFMLQFDGDIEDHLV